MGIVKRNQLYAELEPAAFSLLVVILFLRHIKASASDSRSFFESLDKRQAARDERLAGALDANTRTVVRVEGILAGQHKDIQPVVRFEGLPEGRTFEAHGPQ